MVDYKELYDELGGKLLTVINQMGSMQEGLRKKKNEDLRLGGTSDGYAAKVTLRLKIQEAQCKAITESIKVIKPMADYESKIKELEQKLRQLEG